ncbi:MAG: hypothetical protein RIR00_1106 [Pseudomonadota bacterium]
MNANPNPRCPFQADGTPPSAHPTGAWPPGPAAGLTGWSLLRRMSADLLGSLAAWQARYGDVVHLRIWPEHQIVLGDPALIRELLTRHHDALIRWERGIQVFSRFHGGSVFTQEGEAWRRRRRALQPGYAARNIQNLLPGMAETVAAAMASWPQQAENWPADSALTSLAMDVILRTLFSSGIGADARRAERAVHVLLQAANRELYWPASGPDWLPWNRQRRQSLATLQALVVQHLDARLQQDAATWPEDLLTRLLHQQQALGLSHTDLRDECMTAFLAGHESTAASLSWWAWCMAANPEAQQRARQEVREQLGQRMPQPEDLAKLGYLEQSLQESLRLYPAAPLLFTRRSTRPLQLGPWHFPARTLFLIPIHGLHHDPRYFPDPECFRPERFASDIPRGSFLPFGDGPRICLGQHLASNEMRLIAAMLLQRYRLSPLPGTPVPQARFDVSLRPKGGLRLKLEAAAGR